MRTFYQLKKMDIQPQKEIVEDFRLLEGKHVHESFVPRFWSWLAMTMFARDMREGAIIFSRSRRKREKFRCSFCRSRDIIFRGTISRRFRMVPIGSKGCFWILRFSGLNVGVVGRFVRRMLGFADPRFSYTHAFERYALELSRHMTIQDVARHLGISWDVIKEIQKRDLTRRFSKPCLKNVRRIAIDEISVRKGHRYLTVVLDMDTGAA